MTNDIYVIQFKNNKPIMNIYLKRFKRGINHNNFIKQLTKKLDETFTICFNNTQTYTLTINIYCEKTKILNFDLGLIKLINDVCNVRYPDTVSSINIYNCPKALSLCFELCLKIIDKITLNKINLID